MTFHVSGSLFAFKHHNYVTTDAVLSTIYPFSLDSVTLMCFQGENSMAMIYMVKLYVKSHTFLPFLSFNQIFVSFNACERSIYYRPTMCCFIPQNHYGLEVSLTFSNNQTKTLMLPVPGVLPKKNIKVRYFGFNYVLLCFIMFQSFFL